MTIRIIAHLGQRAKATLAALEMQNTGPDNPITVAASMVHMPISTLYYLKRNGLAGYAARSGWWITERGRERLALAEVEAMERVLN